MYSNMARLVAPIFLLVFGAECVSCHYYLNYTADLAGRQLLDFRMRHPLPSLLTTSSGEPVEIRDTMTFNNDLFANNFHLDAMSHLEGERTPERSAFAKGVSALGYFEVTHDVSKYTSADVFNGIGKKTPVNTRFSIDTPNLGGSEFGHNSRGLAVKFYTRDGNLDLVCIQVPVYTVKDPLDIGSHFHAFKRNPRTNLFDQTMAWDFLTLKPLSLHNYLWVQSDYGSPRGYRMMDGYAIHTFELNNKHGDKYYAKFNFRTEQGLANFSTAENMAISALDRDYYTRDLYNAIRGKDYPAWTLEMDIMTINDIKNLDYNPFDVSVLWRKGTYHTVTVGRLVLDQTVNNHFAESEQLAYNPSNLVPGIPGPVDFLFKGRRFSYKDAHNYRLGVNHNRIAVNMPKYAQTYNRDGNPPLGTNMADVPNYYPNSFNGPMPYVDETRPDQTLLVLESNVVDFREHSYFYNHIIKDDAHRQRIANNLARTLLPVIPNIARRALKTLSLIDTDLGKRVAHSLRILKAVEMKISDEERWFQNARCFERKPLLALRFNNTERY